jgi:hypothetical protein
MDLASSPENEASLEAKAEDAGGLPAAAANGEAPRLPVWHLGLYGSLHRRDIYDDVG